MSRHICNRCRCQPCCCSPRGKRASGSLERQVGHSYVFMRENHDCHGCEVSVLSINGTSFTVARCSNVADALLAPKGSPKRNIKTWKCTEAELW